MTLRKNAPLRWSINEARRNELRAFGNAGIIVMRCPGSPYTDTPTTFDETDLENAITLGLVRKQQIVGSYEWEYYVPTK